MLGKVMVDESTVCVARKWLPQLTSTYYLHTYICTRAAQQGSQVTPKNALSP